MLTQGASGADDVGDGVGHTELDRDLDGTVEADDLGGETAVGEVAAYQVGVRGGDPLAARSSTVHSCPAGAA